MLFGSKAKQVMQAGMVILSLAVAVPVLAANDALNTSENINDVKFPVGLWNPSLLEIIERGPNILPRDTVFEVALPPSNDSEVTRAELDNLLVLQDVERSDEEVRRIMWEHTGKKAHEIFMNEGLLHESNYKTDRLMRMIDADHSYFILERKQHFARPRPNQLDEKLETVLANPGHAAYPSGHSSQTYMVAIVLSDFDPDNAQVYKQFAYDVAHRREIAGFHYVGDSIEGRKLAVDVLAGLRENEIFEKKYQEAKASYIKPSADAIEKYRAYLDARGERVSLMAEVQAEWEEIGFIPE